MLPVWINTILQRAVFSRGKYSKNQSFAHYNSSDTRFLSSIRLALQLTHYRTFYISRYYFFTNTIKRLCTQKVFGSISVS